MENNFASKECSALPDKQNVPAALLWKPLTTGDASALTSLYSGTSNEISSPEAFTAEELQRTLGSPDMLDTVGGWHNEKLVAYASLYNRGVTEKNCELSLDVAAVPAWQTECVSQYLRDWFLTATQRLRSEFSSVDKFGFYTLLPENQPWVKACVERLGFQAEHIFSDMSLSLSDYSAVVPHSPLCRIIPFSHQFSDDVRQACNESFSDHWGTSPWSLQSWKDDVTEVPEFLAELSFLLISQDKHEVIAFIMSSLETAEKGVNVNRTCYIDFLGTRHGFRGKGLATMLLRHTLNTAAAQGYHKAALMVDSDGSYDALGLYCKNGFITLSQRTAFTLDIQVLP